MTIKKRLQKICSVVLAASMVACMTPSVDIMAAGTQNSKGTASGGLCKHHPKHTDECGYNMGGGVESCTHKHGKDCYVLTDSEDGCTHDHTSKCYGMAEEDSGDGSSLGEEETGEPTGEPTKCAHICSEKTGCLVKVLDCPHDRGDHDEECGYAEREEGHECEYRCEECEGDANSEGGGVSGGNQEQDGTLKDDALQNGALEDDALKDDTLKDDAAKEDGVLDEEETKEKDGDRCDCLIRCTPDFIDSSCPVCSLDDTGASCEAKEADVDECVCTVLCTEDAVNDDCPICSVNGPGASCEAKEADVDECVCEILCTEDDINEGCPVCSAKDADLRDCAGEELDTALPEGPYRITGFDKLPKEVREQPVAAKTALAKLNLPKTLEAEGYEITATASEASSPEPFTIGEVTWELTADLNDGVTVYDEEAETGGYIFTPELPEGYVLEEDAELPKVMVMVGAVETQAEAELGLVLGETYYFDLSSAVFQNKEIPGTSNESLPDPDLHFTPFTYVGTINAYSLTDSNPMPNSNPATSDRNLFVADYVLKTDVSYSELGDFPIALRGRSYGENGINGFMRLPSVGNQTGSNGAVSPDSNEWDRILAKDPGYIKNQEIGSIGQDWQTTTFEAAYREEGRGLVPNQKTAKGPSYGFRPVLEVDNSNLKVVNIDLNGASLGGETVIKMIRAESASSWKPPEGMGLQFDSGTFKNWNTLKNGSGTEIRPRESAYADTIYAQWNYTEEPPVGYGLYFRSGKLYQYTSGKKGLEYTENAGRWEGEGNTLTLGSADGPFEFTTADIEALYLPDPTTIKLVGTGNKIESTYDGNSPNAIRGINGWGGNITIEGPGSLDVISGKNANASGNMGIMSTGSITIDGATVKVGTGGGGSFCRGILTMSGGGLTLKNKADLTVASGTGTSGGIGLSLGNGDKFGRIELQGADNKLIAKGTTQAVKIGEKISKYSYPENGMEASVNYDGEQPYTAFTFDSEHKTYQVSGTNAQYIKVTSIEGLPTDFSGGVGKSDEPYIIGTDADMTRLATMVNDGTKDYKDCYFVMKDDVSSLKVTTAIGSAAHPFRGKFDGKGKTINLDISNGSADYQGVFGYIGTEGEVTNLGVTGSVTGGSYTGGVAGFCSGKIQKCYNTATVTGAGYVGGVAGMIKGKGGWGTEGETNIVENCYNTGAVTGESNVGGVAGRLEDSIYGLLCCYNTGNVTGTNGVGGIVGTSGVCTLKNCVSLGMKVTGSGSVGRVAGSVSGSDIGSNSARGDMKIGASGSEAVKTEPDEKLDGSDVALESDLAAVFGSWDKTNTWEIPSGGKLTVDKELPTLKLGDGAPSQDVKLPGFSIKIDTPPTGRTVTYEDIKETDKLTVGASANSGEGVAVTYQWYSASSADKADPVKIEGASGADFQIPADLEAGDHFYFCRLSATDCSDMDTGVVTVKVDKGTYSGTVEITKLFKLDTIKVTAESGSITLEELFPDGVPAGAEIDPVIEGTNAALYKITVVEKKRVDYTSASGSTTIVQEGTTNIKITSKNYSEITGRLIFKIVDKTPVTVEGVTVTGAGKEYDGNAVEYTGKKVTVADGGQDVTGEVSLVYKWQKKLANGSYEDLAEAPKDAGSYRLAVSPAPDSEYMGEPNNIDFEIKQKKLTISPQDMTVKQDDPLPAFKLKFDGLVTGESLAPVGELKISCDTDKTDKVGSYNIKWENKDDITFQGPTKDNYAITTSDTATLTVEKKEDPTPGGSGGSSGSDGSGGGSSTTGTSGSGPAQSMTGAVDANTTVDDSGNANVTVTEQTVNAAVAAAKAEAQRRGVTVKDVSVVIQVTSEQEAQRLTANLPKVVQDKLLSQQIGSVEIKSSDVSMRFTGEALREISRQAQADVMVSASRVDNNTLSPQARAVIGSRPAYEFTVAYGNGERVREFGQNSVFLEIPYTLAQGENPERVQIYYIDDNGGLHGQFSTYNMERQTAVAVTGHYSVYAVGYRSDTPVYRDVDHHWAKEDIEYVASRSLIDGAKAGMFAPDAAITRGAFAAALGRLARVNPDEYRTLRFSDVPAEAYYAPYAAWAAEKGVMTEAGEGQFAPDQPLTREQMAVSLVRFAGETGHSFRETYQAAPFTDETSISAAASKEADVMRRAGILIGKDGNRFDPQGIVTRGEAAAALHRFVQRVSDPAASPDWVRNDSGHSLYFEDGKAAAGWKQLDGKWYYFNADGTLAVNTVVDGYWVGPDGVRMES